MVLSTSLFNNFIIVTSTSITQMKVAVKVQKIDTKILRQQPMQLIQITHIDSCRTMLYRRKKPY